ncbi:MAG: hypothetical protein ABSA83_13500 [Verrucomicrobiota bacterium]|jgi:hypothetical protein
MRTRQLVWPKIESGDEVDWLPNYSSRLIDPAVSVRKTDLQWELCNDP